MPTSGPSEDCSPGSVSRQGVIEAISDTLYIISVPAVSACSECHARGSCRMGHSGTRIIKVPRQGNVDFRVGDAVEVYMKRSLGLRAVFLGYVLPFIILLGALIITVTWMENEAHAALLSLGILVLYYTGLWAFKKHLTSVFKFHIKHNGNTHQVLPQRT
ncbi:MAG: SoxR reducing system RseC family protein [Bacteroidales bacterium]|nr:SoxR reducing system RseC family protein [Bacteroidales bacterium]